MVDAGSLVSSRRADLDLAGRGFKLVLIESRREVIRQALLGSFFGSGLQRFTACLCGCGLLDFQPNDATSHSSPMMKSHPKFFISVRDKLTVNVCLIHANTT
jgi:hypothetical protein